MKLTIKDIRDLRTELPETVREILARKFPDDIVTLIKNRMIMGYFRYGVMYDSYKERALMEPSDVTIVRALSKFIQFIKTKNLEFAVDVVVYIFLLWRWSDDKLYFKSVERHEVEELKAQSDKEAYELYTKIRRSR